MNSKENVKIKDLTVKEFEELMGEILLKYSFPTNSSIPVYKGFVWKGSFKHEHGGTDD